MAADRTKPVSRANVGTKRVVDKSAHRLALLDATACVIAQHGISGTTISRIQEASGLSRGLIHLHFQSKDNLIAELARHLDAEYQSSRKLAIADVGTDPKARLREIIRVEFSTRILNPGTNAVWMALRSECHARREILRDVDTRDWSIYREIFSCFSAMSGPASDPVACRRATLALMTMLEGLFTDLHLHPDNFNRDEAVKVCLFAADALELGIRQASGGWKEAQPED